MINLPYTTQFNKKIPKQKFYEKIDIKPELKKLFNTQIKAIYWKNKIDHNTTNLAQGKYITEIEIFEIELNQKDIDMDILKLIDKNIPYHILFTIVYQTDCKACIAYKEISQNKDKIKIYNYYHTPWIEKDKIILNIDSLDIDKLYENIILQIADKKLGEISANTLKEKIEKFEKIQNLEKQINTLKNKIKKEKQFNKQIELNDKFKKLKKELNNLY